MLYYILFIVTVLFTGCKKEFLDRKPISDLTVENAVYDENSADVLVQGVYAPLRTHNIYGKSLLFIYELPSDDIIYNEQNSNHAALDNLRPNSNIPEFKDLWRGCYDGVQRANFALTALRSSTQISDELKSRGRGELLFLRSVYYWHLINVFGAVPYYDEVPRDYEDLFRPEKSQSEIYTLIENDLKEAITLNLPVKWSDDFEGRATVGAAKSFLGKMYLFQQKWGEAVDVLKDVAPDNNIYGYRLLENYLDVFDIKNKNSDEAILEIQFKAGVATVQAGVYFSEGGVSGLNNFRNVIMGVKGAAKTINFGELLATRDIFNEYEPLDPRLRASLWIQRQDQYYTNGNLFPYNAGQNVRVGHGGQPGKYFHVRKGLPGTITANPTILSDEGNNIPMIRFADVKLMYAEALAEAGDLTNAIVYLNQVRARANRDPFPYTTTYGGHNFTTLTYAKYPGTPVSYTENLEDFRKALVHERRVELAFEYHRFSDLVRWSKIPNHPGSAVTVFAQKGSDDAQSGIEDRKEFLVPINYVFPKPLLEVTKSRGTINQNPGYQ